MNPHVKLTDEAQIKTVESIKRLSPDGKLYYMESVWDYSVIPDVFQVMFGAGCSTFLTKNLEGPTFSAATMTTPTEKTTT